LEKEHRVSYLPRFPEGNHGEKVKEPVQPRLLQAEPANHGRSGQ